MVSVQWGPGAFKHTVRHAYNQVPMFMTTRCFTIYLYAALQEDTHCGLKVVTTHTESQKIDISAAVVSKTSIASPVLANFVLGCRRILKDLVIDWVMGEI